MRSHLVRAKVYPLIRKKASSCCGKSWCETCFNIQETDTFQIFLSKEIYKNNHYFHFESKFVIDLISCKVCDLQYVGSTVDSFRGTIIYVEGGTIKNVHKGSGQKMIFPPSKKLDQHLLSEKHHGLLEYCEIRLIDKTDPSDPTRSKNWMQKLKALAPFCDGVKVYRWKVYKIIRLSL